MATLSTLQLPLPWDEFDLPSPLQTRATTLVEGPPAWRWTDGTPDFPVEACDLAAGHRAEGWDLDHVVLLVPSLEEAIENMGLVGEKPRLRMPVNGRPAAFFLVGPVLEVIESPVRRAALYGLVLTTEEPLETIVLRWRSMGRDVTDPKPAIQPGRRIFTVRATEAGFAVMSPDQQVSGIS